LSSGPRGVCNTAGRGGGVYTAQCITGAGERGGGQGCEEYFEVVYPI